MVRNRTMLGGHLMNYRETMSRLNNALNHIDSAYVAIAKKHGLTFNGLMTVCLIAESDNVTQKKFVIHYIFLNLLFIVFCWILSDKIIWNLQLVVTKKKNILFSHK